jgi:SH3-like domain-containing protein
MRNTMLLLYIILFTLGTIRYVCALCVSVPTANLRAGPGKEYPITWTVEKYMPFVKVGQSLNGEWYAVQDVDGDVHWIYKNLVTEKYRAAVIKADGVNIRKGPGTNYPKSSLSPGSKYYSYKVLQTKGAWVKVMGPWGTIAWIHKKFLWIR